MNNMKRNIVFLLALFCFAAHAQPKVNFREGKLADHLKEAKAQHKPLFFMGYATWCPHCNKMKKEVFTDTVVADFFNRNFVCAWQDMELGEGPALRKELHIKSYPAFVFFSPEGEFLYSSSAEYTADQIIQEAKNALDEKKQFPYLKSEFEKDVTNAEKCLSYVSALRRSNMDTEPAAKKYLSTQTDPQLVSAVNWRIIANGIRDINSREFQYVLKNQDQFATVSSKKRVEKKIINMVQEWLNPYVEVSDTVNYFKKRGAAAMIGLRKTDSLVYNYDLKILENTKNWKSYRKATAVGVKRFSWDNAQQLKEIAMVYMNDLSGKQELADAIEWSKRSLELKESYDTLIVIARLYLKAGDTKNAREWGEKARAMAVNYKWNTDKADEILQQIKS